MRTYLVRKGMEEEEASETQKNTAESQAPEMNLLWEGSE